MSTVKCCPTVTGNAFSFMCRDNEYGGHATATPGAVWTGLITGIGIPTPTEESVTRTPSTDEGIEAWGTKLISVSPDSQTYIFREVFMLTGIMQVVPLSTSTSTPSSRQPSTSSTFSNTPTPGPAPAPLSTGATAGIAIGAAALLVAILGTGAFLMWKRKRASKKTTPEAGGDAVAEMGVRREEDKEIEPNQEPKSELGTHNEAPMLEMDAQNRVQMLDSRDLRPGGTEASELQG